MAIDVDKLPAELRDMPKDKLEQLLFQVKCSTPATLAQMLSGSAADGLPKFLIPPHIQQISLKLAEATLEGGKRTIISVPPRHGKSFLCSTWYPFFHLLHRPERPLILASYEFEFATKWGRAVRDLVNLYGGKFGMKVRSDMSAAHDWMLEGHSGGMFTTGVGGPATGRGGDILLDDYHKNWEEASSQTMRDKLWDWWRTTLYSRCEVGCSITVIATRWHEDDLIGRLLKEMANDGEQWNYIRFPAIAEGPDSIGRDRGHPLWPRRFSTKWFEGRRAEKRDPKEKWNDLGIIKKTSGPRHWQSLYQQNPVPDEGGIFKKDYFRDYVDMSDHYDLRPQQEKMRSRKLWKKDCWRVMVADTAMTDKTWSDYTVIQVWDIERQWPGKSELDRAAVLVDQWRERALTPKIETQLRQMVDKYKPVFTAVEERNNGIEIVQRFRRDGIPVRPIKANTSKVSRAANAEIWMAAGMVFFPLDTPWRAELDRELLNFMPGAAHDDQVDCVSMALNLVSEKDLWEEKSVHQSASYPKDSWYYRLGMDKEFNPPPKRRSDFLRRDSALQQANR